MRRSESWRCSKAFQQTASSCRFSAPLNKVLLNFSFIINWTCLHLYLVYADAAAVSTIIQRSNLTKSSYASFTAVTKSITSNGPKVVYFPVGDTPGICCDRAHKFTSTGTTSLRRKMKTVHVSESVGWYQKSK
jgi:hypothetical protein